jgi:hypothetical protein
VGNSCLEQDFPLSALVYPDLGEIQSGDKSPHSKILECCDLSQLLFSERPRSSWERDDEDVVGIMLSRSRYVTPLSRSGCAAATRSVGNSCFEQDFPLNALVCSDLGEIQSGDKSPHWYAVPKQKKHLH